MQMDLSLKVDAILRISPCAVEMLFALTMRHRLKNGQIIRDWQTQRIEEIHERRCGEGE